MTPNPLRSLLLALVIVVVPTRLFAQDIPRKATLPSLDTQGAARLIALEKKLDPTHSLERVIGLIGDAAASPLHPFATILTDSHNLETWDQLGQEYYRLTQGSGDALISVTSANGAGVHSEQVRRLCHRRLAALPKATLEADRQRVDAEARALLEQGKRTRSPIPLRRLEDDLFCSTPGDQALDLLGDLCFEQGQFEDARHWWSLLAPFGGERDGRLIFPHPKVDLARVQG